MDVRADLGGGSVHLALLLERLNCDQYEAYVAAPSDQHFSAHYQKFAQKMTTIPFRSFSIVKLLQLRKFVEENKIHLIHSHGRGAGIYSRLLGRLVHLPVVHTFHGISYQKSSFFQSLGLKIEKWLGQFTTRLIHVSDSERKFGMEMGVSDLYRSRVIRNGIDVESFSAQQSKREEMRSQLNLSNQDFVIGCVARFDSCKRHEDLILAISKVILRNPNVKLILIGGGETKEKIKRLVKDRALDQYVQFLGERADAKLFYQAFDLFALVSSFEGLPLTPLEALASQCPVLLTYVRGNCDIIQHEITGILVPPHDPESLSHAIEHLIENISLREKLAKGGYEMVRENYSITETVNSIEALYRELCPFPDFRRVVLVHDWLFHMRGGEKVLEAIGEIFPSARINTLFLHLNGISESLKSHPIRASWLNCLPGVKQFYRFLLPVLPFVMKQFELKPCDLIISSSHSVAKGIRKPPQSIHVCYCHTPMRYAWGFESEYFGKYPVLFQRGIEQLMKKIRACDLDSNKSVDFFIANSKNVQHRIRTFYNRESDVIYPPIKIVNTRYDPGVKDYFLIVSALVPYKRIDLAIEAFNELNSSLFVIGSGPLLSNLKQKARAHIQFLGWLGEDQIVKYYESCKALIFPTEEDFGMVPVEAMMYGKPVIAYAKGGALETVIPANDSHGKPSPTGIFFYEQTAQALREAVKQFSEYPFDAEAIRQHAESFKTEYFKDKFKTFLREKVINRVYSPIGK